MKARLWLHYVGASLLLRIRSHCVRIASTTDSGGWMWLQCPLMHAITVISQEINGDDDDDDVSPLLLPILATVFGELYANKCLLSSWCSIQPRTWLF